MDRPDLNSVASRLVYLADQVTAARGPKATQIAEARLDGAGEVLTALGLAPTAFAVRMAVKDAVDAAGPRHVYGPGAKEQRRALVADLEERLNTL